MLFCTGQSMDFTNPYFAYNINTQTVCNLFPIFSFWGVSRKFVLFSEQQSILHSVMVFGKKMITLRTRIGDPVFQKPATILKRTNDGKLPTMELATIIITTISIKKWYTWLFGNQPIFHIWYSRNTDFKHLRHCGFLCYTVATLDLQYSYSSTLATVFLYSAPISSHNLM